MYTTLKFFGLIAELTESMIFSAWQMRRAVVNTKF